MSKQHKDEGIFSKVDKSKDDSKEVTWCDISSHWTKDGWEDSSYKNGYNFIDLFSGAGGLTCGLVMAGFTPLASVEIIPEAVETYKHNFISSKNCSNHIETRDICKKETKESLYEEVKGIDIDLITGGFPCQGFSMSGSRVVTDKRNSLYLEMLEIVDKLQPKFVMMENVQGIRSMLGGKVEAKIIQDYKKIGYDISVTTLNSADYFTPQTRKRVIFIGNRINAKNIYPKPLISKEDYVTLGESLEKYIDLDEDKTINHIFTRHSEDMKDRLMNVPEGESLYKGYSDAWRKSPWNEPSCTVKENHGGVNIHPKLPRVLTPRELATLQSFPEDFIFKGTKKWQLVQIGNAVPPLLAKAIGISIEKALELNI